MTSQAMRPISYFKKKLSCMLLRLRPKILAFVERLFSLAALALIVLFARRFSMQNVLGLAKKG